MKIALNRGTNISDAEILRYDLLVLPQKIFVDGVAHETRAGSTNADVDAWIKSAKVHPYVLGTSAAETVEAFQKLGATEREILVITVAKNLSQSHVGAVSAARTFAKMPGRGNVKIAIIDTQSVDVGSALASVLAAEASRAGLPFEQVVRLTNQFCQNGQTLIGLRDLSYMVKGGRASFLKAMVANLIDRSPIIGVVDRELAQIKTVKRSELLAEMASLLVQKLGPHPRSRRVWVGLSHGNDEESAEQLATLLKKELTVAYCVIRPIHSSTYLHVGPRGVGAFVAPIDDLEWTPPVPA